MSETTTLPPSPPDTSPGPGPGPRIGVIAGLVAVGAVIFLAIAAVYAVRGKDDTADGNDGWHGTQVTGYPRPDFTLTDTAGKPYDFAAQTKGRVTLLFFGYTHCPDVCPAHMSILDGALEIPGTPKPIVVFVTTDPERDTGPVLRKWLDQYDEDFVGLTGSPDQILAAERSAKVAGSMRLPDDDTTDDDYTVGHAAQIVAYSPDDVAHVVYPYGTRAADWAADLPKLLAQDGSGSPRAQSEPNAEAAG
jgi:protein SCO1